MADIVRSNVNEVLDRIEDPEKMVRQMIRNMEEAVDRAVSSVGAAVANQRRLEKQQDEYREKALDFAERAQRCVEAGDDELARRALERKVYYQQTADDLEPAIAESREVTEKMKDHLHEVRTGLKEATSRQGSLIARCQAAKERGAPSSGDEPTPGDPFAEFQRLERRISRHESEFERLKQQLQLEDDAVDAEDEIRSGETAEERKLDRRLQELAVQERVDEELAELRGKTSQTDK
jgi:phage shock protein A